MRKQFVLEFQVTAMKHNYRDLTKEVVEKAGIPKEYVFDFSDHELKQLFDDFFQQCQSNLDNERPFLIEPAKLFFGPDETVNAWALKLNGYYLMCINLGLVINFLKMFLANGETFSSGDLKKYRSLQELGGFSLETYMFRWASYFIFHHEKAHLIQFTYGSESSLNERYSLIPSITNFSLKHHLYELDADSYASLLLGRTIGRNWIGLIEENRTEENLYLLYVCGLATIFVMFLSFQNPYTSIYYEEGDHPHPWVRTMYSVPSIIDGISRVLEREYSPKDENVISDVVKIIDAILLRQGRPTFGASAQAIWQELDNVKKYTFKTLLANTHLFPELMVNRKP